MNVAENEPTADGVKVSWTVQCEPGAILTPPQLLVWVKRPGLAPLLVNAVMLRLPAPESVTVTGSVLLRPTTVVGKLSEVAERVTAGAGWMTVPSTCSASAVDWFRLLVVMLTYSLSAVDEPTRLDVFGEKLVDIVQLFPGARTVFALQSVLTPLASGKSVG